MSEKYRINSDTTIEATCFCQICAENIINRSNKFIKDMAGEFIIKKDYIDIANKRTKEMKVYNTDTNMIEYSSDYGKTWNIYDDFQVENDENT